MSAMPTAATAFDFISARTAAAPCTGKETATLLSAESQSALLTPPRLRRPATRSGRNGCTHGLACRKAWITTSRADRLLHRLGPQSTRRTFAQMKLPRRPAAVVFDMDGLLFDTEALYQEAAVLAAADGGHNVSSGVFGQTIGLAWPQSRSVLLAHFGLSFPVEEFIA